MGITLDQRFTFSKHVKRATEKAHKVMKALAAIMPNVCGPGMRKRRVICSAAQSILMYGAEIWGTVLELKKYRAMATAFQRQLGLGLCIGSHGDRWYSALASHG